MADDASVYAPTDLFPTPQELVSLAPDDADVDVDPDAESAKIRWPGMEVVISRMDDEAMGEHLGELSEFVRENQGGEPLVLRLLSTLSVFQVVGEPTFDANGRAIVKGLTNMTEGLSIAQDGELRDGEGAALLLKPEKRLEAPAGPRVARRALILLTLSVRGLLEQDAGTENQEDSEAVRGDLVAWVREQLRLVDEAEPEELELLQTPIGKADEQQIIDAVWQSEGALVLLWALAHKDLPGHEAHVHPYQVAKSVGILGTHASTLLRRPIARPPEEVEPLRRRLLGLHWRLREQVYNPEPVDFAGFAADNWFGGFDARGIPLAEDGDLAIGGTPISHADPRHVNRATSVAMERHQAANWLIGAHPTYSRVATPT